MTVNVYGQLKSCIETTDILFGNMGYHIIVGNNVKICIHTTFSLAHPFHLYTHWQKVQYILILTKLFIVL
jgi:hypothetical protein